MLSYILRAALCVWNQLEMKHSTHIYLSEGMCHPVQQCGFLIWFLEFLGNNRAQRFQFVPVFLLTIKYKSEA